MKRSVPWFSLDNTRRKHKHNWKKMGTSWFLTLPICRRPVKDSAFYPFFLFSFFFFFFLFFFNKVVSGSDFIASENQFKGTLGERSLPAHNNQVVRILHDCLPCVSQIRYSGIFTEQSSTQILNSNFRDQSYC